MLGIIRTGEVDSLYRTDSSAGTAAGALIVVDDRVEVLHSNSAGGTFFLAHLTADTAVLAVLLRNLSVGAAKDIDLFSSRLNGNKVIWTDINALSASAAQCRQHFSDTIFDANGIMFADLSAVAESEAAELT